MICLGEVLRARRGSSAVIELKRERAARMHCEQRWHVCKVLTRRLRSRRARGAHLRGKK